MKKIILCAGQGLLAVVFVFSIQSWAIGGEPVEPAAADQHMTDMGGMAAQQTAPAPGWMEELKGQTIIENAIEGHSNQMSRVDQQMSRMDQLMQAATDQMAKEEQHSKHTGAFTAMEGPGHQMDMFTGMLRTGVLLGPSNDADESTTPGPRCPKEAPVKTFDITAINVMITLNQWLDYFPGYMYVLTENIDKVRAEEARNKKAREAEYDPGAVSNGLQGDMIQPLTIRANQGDCVIITLTNKVDDEPVGFHIHGASMIIKSTGKAALATNPDTTVATGKSQVFEWYIPPSWQEGALTFHSHGNREQSGLGLTGVFVVEPAGSKYLDPFTGKELKSGWEAMIEQPHANGEHDFREYMIMYHEVGDESFRPVSKNGEMIPQRDPITDAYRPSARALNYRSEPFGVNNLSTQKARFGFEDEAEAYSAYTFGDPATPIPRAYLGDPTKFRLVHGGSDIFHSHHPHGGTIRWQRDPKAERTFYDSGRNGPVKFPRMRSMDERVDVQVLGPTTVFDLEPECGAGLCQHLAADFLYHCHVAHHYVAGMWAFWRVYNTLQVPGYQQDVMPSLQELPDRVGKMKKAVDSTQLIGTTVDWYGKKFMITKDQTDWNRPIPLVSIKDWVTAMVPPQGQPGHTDDWKGQILAEDATVWDWAWKETPKGMLALSERETTQKWPKYTPPAEFMGDKVGPAGRRKMAFDPLTGKLAWPHMQPHFGKRPPFARNHGPAPWLEPFHLAKGGWLQKDDVFNPYSDPGGPSGGGGVSGIETDRPARPGEQGPWSLCPSQSDNMAQRKLYRINVIGQLPITLAKGEGKNPPVVDNDGLLYVLKEEEAEVRKNNDMRVPLVYRANVYDCIDAILTNGGWRDDEENGFASKLNIHPHFWQFDNQASDGVISGFSYEQAVRPYKDELIVPDKGLPAAMNGKLAKAGLFSSTTKAGSTKIVLTDAKAAAKFHVDTDLGVGMDQVETFEIRRIKSISGKTITFYEPLLYDHQPGEIVSVEFVRYRYYPDADFGTVYWHDHAFGAISWQHGAFGSTIIEPPGSTYHDPKTGKLRRSGYVVDIHTNDPSSIDTTGSFREMVLHIQDTMFSTANSVSTGSPPELLVQAAAAANTLAYPIEKQKDIKLTPNPYINGGTHTTGSALNMRLAPLNRRLAVNPDPTLVFSSKVHGDPDTPLLRAYLGDPIMIRNLVTAINETHTIHVDGHWFRYQRYNPDSMPRDTIHIGIAERHDLSIPAAGGPQQMPGDYLYYNGRASKLTEGSWGIIRVLDKPVKDLEFLPQHEEIPAPAKSVCPADAPVKTFDVMAIDKSLVYNPRAEEAVEVDFDRKLQVANPSGKIFILADDKAKVAGNVEPMPLTLHVNVGDCLKVKLKNEMKKDRTGFHVGNMAYDPLDSMGINVGMNPGDQTIGPGESKLYTFYASPDIGENAGLIQDWADGTMAHQRDGLFGAVVIGPKGSLYRDPVTGKDISMENSWRADVLVDRTIPGNENRPNYRDFALFFQDEDNILGTSFMPYLQHAAGLVGINYRSEPLALRLDNDCAQSVLFTCIAEGKSADPVTPILETHAGDPVIIHVFGAFNEQNGVFSVEGHQWPEEPFLHGADMVSSFEFGGSELLSVYLNAGGPFRLTGDYLYQNHRMAYTEGGEWGFLRVLDPGDRRILSLKDNRPRLRTVGLELNK